ncbi:MAG: hypothetical protein AB7P11_04850 [Hydrogenophaga sp.]
MASRPLAAWVRQGPSGLVANHVPFLLDRQRGAFGTLIASSVSRYRLTGSRPSSRPARMKTCRTG